MAQQPVTKEQVFAAAEQLDQAGQKPTVALVRSKLGRGSNSTLTPFLAEWRMSKKQATETATERIPLPEQLMENIAAFAQVFWDMAVQHADERLEEDRKEFEEKLTEIQEGMNEAGDLSDQLSIENDKLREEMELLKQQLQQEITDKETLKEQLAEIRSEASTSHARVEEMGRWIENMKKDHDRQLATWQSEIAQEREAIVKLSQEHQQRSIELAELRAQFNHQQSEIVRFQKETSSLHEKNRELEVERNAAKEEAAAQAVNAGKLTGQVEALQQNMSQQQAIIRSLTEAKK